MGKARPLDNVPIVVFGDDWGRNVSSMQHLFQHVARTHAVIWINAIGHRVPGMGDLRRASEKLRRVVRRGAPAVVAAPASDVGTAPRVIIQPKVLPWHHYRFVRAFNARSLRGAISKALVAGGFRERPILVTGSPPAVSVLGTLGERVSLYYCMDDFLHLPNVSHDMIRPLEAELLRRVDGVVSTARALVDAKRPSSGRSWYLPQGVNYDHFATRHPTPPDLSALPRPLAGFAGGVGSPLDVALVRRVAQAIPTGSVVLIGPVRMDPALFGGGNIHVLGPRPYRDLPAYVQAFDVGLIPYELNEHTVAVDPLKLLEYLAAGVPVVTTDLPEVHKYREAVAIEAPGEGFVDAVRKAIQAGGANAARGQALAREHRWERRAEALLEILCELDAGVGR